MENHLTKLDKAVKISIIAGTLIVALSIGYYLVIFLPNKDAKQLEQLKQQTLLKSSDGQTADYIDPVNQISDTSDTQPALDMSDIEQKNQANANNYSDQTQNNSSTNKEKADDEYKKIQKNNYEAQLKVDKQAYNDAIEKLKRDYDYAVDKVNAQIVKEGLHKSTHDCADGTEDEQRCQINERAYAQYGVELDYLEKTYKANLKAINATKYW